MDLDRKTIRRLAGRAEEASRRCYAPYSRFAVGAAVLASSGRIYTGANIENASYPAGICAERSAVSRAVSCGERKILAVAISGGPAEGGRDFCPPCGICRQVIREFCDPSSAKIILTRRVPGKGRAELAVYTLEELLPQSFGPDSLVGI